MSAPIIWRMMARDDDDTKDGGAVDAVIPPIDHRDAERLDEHIRGLAEEHLAVIRAAFYKMTKNGPGELAVGAAERALQDRIDWSRT